MSNHNASLQKAIDIVGEAIREDQESNWEKALGLYNRALEYFMHHIKYEKNAKAKEMITLRVKGYMDRAEQIKKIIDEGNKPKKKRRASANGDEDDKEKDKLHDSLMSSIIQDKPNVKWDDVAGLEGAKTSLK